MAAAPDSTPTAQQTDNDRNFHMAQLQGDNYLEGWASLWKNKGAEPPSWDRGFPNPALEDTLVHGRALLGGPLMEEEGSGEKKRKKALVPGCGSGFDVFLLASFGYDAYGLDYSDVAVEICRQEEAKAADKYPVRDPAIGRGKMTFVQGDFFSDDWLDKLGLQRNSFDLIYDYTFFCALPPSLRPKWALRHTQLLSPSPIGNLICVEFPTNKDPLSEGPPYAAPPAAYMEHLSHPGEEIPYDSKGNVKLEPLRETSYLGLERVSHWQPERTHEVGKNEKGEVQDWVSVWRRRH
ncbi:hypothetical protein VTN77DRAFT_3964 [Rasamsonia byssochlamydoides]|uniref:uncharacterized protein n=1 Tax=Rasamsonia byssochlamydoides TaxID=89139 RepID=UPI0037424447